MRWVVTGGAGFIGTNLVCHLMELGHTVTVIDDLSRDGVRRNAQYLADRYQLPTHEIDVASHDSVSAFLESRQRVDVIAHLAGQVSLMSSIASPMRDFEVNARGTLNLLEFVRTHNPDAALIGMASNKVYGDLHQVHIREDAMRFVAPDYPDGFDESLPLEFHGPYGCSKGVADQYLGDYARTFGLRTASLRQSSVYGPYQHPRADQGWVAHLMGEAVGGRSIQLNGIGKQVRDLLHARDLARLFVLLAENIEPYQVNQFNVGGGTANALSILELFSWIEGRLEEPVRYETGVERPSDQRVFVSDNTLVQSRTGWRPTVGVEEGLEELLEAMIGASRTTDDGKRNLT